MSSNRSGAPRILRNRGPALPLVNMVGCVGVRVGHPRCRPTDHNLDHAYGCEPPGNIGSGQWGEVPGRECTQTPAEQSRSVAVSAGRTGTDTGPRRFASKWVLAVSETAHVRHSFTSYLMNTTRPRLVAPVLWATCAHFAEQGLGGVLTLIDISGVPPSSLGPYAVQVSTDDPRPVGTEVPGTSSPLEIGFDRPTTVLGIGQGWTSWSHGFSGSVYYAPGTELVLVPPPQTVALGLTIQPNLMGIFSFQVTADGRSTSVEINGDGGAQFVGFWSDNQAEPLRYLRIWDVKGTAEGFAIAELAICVIPEPAAFPHVLGVAGVAWVMWFRRRQHPPTPDHTEPTRDASARIP